MANLGTLWFDVDLNLSKLQESIQKGNAQVLKDLKISLAPDAPELKKSIENILQSQNFKVNLEANKDSVNKIKEQLGQLTANIKLSSSGASLSQESIQSIVNLLSQQSQKTQEVANATKAASESAKQASNEEAEAAKKKNLEIERQKKLLYEVQSFYSKIASLSPGTTGLSPAKINETANAFQNLASKLQSVPPKSSLQELAAEFQTLKATSRGFFQELSQSSKAVETIRLVRFALKEVNDQIASGVSSQKLEGFREQLQMINREMHNLMKAGDFAGIQNLFAGHKGFSDGVVNIIRQMVSEMKKLGVATQETAGITSHLTEAEHRLAASIRSSTDSMRGQSQVLGDLKTMAMQYLSVWGAQSFINNIIQTGGLLEQQRMSIGAILGDLAQANHLFGQIQQLALKSPFGVVQLDTMSKQLTAYNFKYSELYDWTKRLADISAATGTEVSRLALALGHVRSEGALSGYTLRQFAMGNVPMLQTLAQQLGKTTAEIRKMTREKAITYDDVEQALRTLTDEGGIFFNAQEVMSNALNAKFKNMHDAFDIMFGKMAESGVGDVLKKVAEALTVLAKNWEQTGAVILSVVGYLGIYKAAMLANNKAIVASNLASGQFTAAQIEMQAASGNLTRQMLLQAVATGKVSIANVEAAAATMGLTTSQLKAVAASGKVSSAYKVMTAHATTYTLAQVHSLNQTKKISVIGPMLMRLQMGWYGITSAAKMATAAVGTFFKAFWPMLAITAVIEGITYLIQKSNEAKDRVKDLLQTANEGFKSLEKSALQFKVGASVSMDDKMLEESIKEMDEVLKSYLPQNAHGVLNEAFKIDPETGKSVHSLKEQYEMLAEEIEVAKEAYKQMAAVGDILERSNDDSDGGIFDKSFRESTEQYINALRERDIAENDFIANNRLKLIDVLKKTREAFDEYDYQVKESISLYKETDGKQGFGEDNLKAQLDLLREMDGEMIHFREQMESAGKDFALSFRPYKEGIFDVKGAYAEMYKDMQTFTATAKSRLVAEFGVPVEQWTRAQKLAVQKATEIFMTGLDGFSNLTEEQRVKIEKDLLRPFKIDIDVDAREANKALTEMQAYLNEMVGKDWVVTLKLQTVGSFEQLYDQLDKDVKDGMATMKKLGTEFTAKRRKELQNMTIDTKTLTGSEKEYAEAYQKTEKAKETAAKKNWKLSSLEKQNAKDAAAARKEETAAEKARKKAIEEQKTQLEEVKKFYAEYKKYREVFGDAKGQSIVEDMFGMKPGEGDRIINNYEEVLDEIMANLEKLGDKKGVLAIKQLKAEINLDKTKKDLDKALKELNEYISRNSEKYNLYESLLEKTGNKDYAKMAFDDGKIWDKVSEDFADKLKKAIESAGKEIDFSKLWDMSDAEANEMLKGINGAYDLWKKIVEIIRGNYIKALNKGADAVSGTMKVEEKLVKLQEELLDLTEKYNKAQTQAEKVSLAAQIKAKKNEVDAAQIEKDNQDIETLQFYNAILSMTVDKAEEVGQKLRENLVRQLEDGKISAEGYVKGIKKIDQQIDTIREKKGFLSFAASGDFEAKRKLELEIADDKWIQASNKLEKAEESLRKAIEKNNAAKTDEEKKKSASEVESAKKKKAVAEANHEEATKNRDAAQKNYDSARKFKASVAAIAMAVQAMVQAFNDAKQAAAAFGEDLDADMDSFGQHYMGILEGLNTGLSRMQQGDFAGAISGAVFGSIASIAQKHDATLQQDIKNSQLIVQRYDNMISILEKRLDNTLGGIYNLTISKEDVDKLYKYLGMQNPETAERIANGQASEAEMEDYIWEMTWARLRGIDTSVGRDLPEDTRNAVLKAIESQSYYDAKLAELYIQRDELQRQLADAEDMKDRDEAQIEDYKQQMAELEEDIKTFALDMANALYDIDIQGWASDLTDAIVEAWENGEDAVEAYNKKVKEMMKDLAKNIIAKKILEKALADAHIDDLISNLMTSSSGVLDESAVVALGDALMGAGQSAATATTALLDYLEAAGYIEKSAEVTETAFSDLRSTFLETLTDIESNAEDFKKSLEQIMVKDVIEKQILDVPFTINGMTFENFDAYLKNWNERYASAIKAGNQALIDALIDELVQAREITIEAAEELRERLKSVDEDTTFEDMSDSWVSNLMDMSKTAEDWAEEVGKTMAEKIIKEMVVPTLIQPYLQALQNAWNEALPKYTTTDASGNKTYNWEGLLGDESILKALDGIPSAYQAARDAVLTILDRLGIDISNYKYSGFDNLADSILESLKKSGNNFGDWAKEQGQKMAEQMAKAYIDQTYKNDIDALNKEWQEALEKGDAAAIDTVRKKLEALYARMGNDPELMKLIDDFRELDTTVTDLADSFVSSLMDMSQSARDWGQDLAKTIAEAVIKMTVVPTLIQPLLQSVQDVFDAAVEGATSYDANGKKTISWEAIINNQGLMSAINAVVEQYPQIKDIIEQIMSAFDVDLYENPFADMVSTFTSSLMDMNATAETFAQNIARTLTEQMMQKVLTDGYKGQLDELGEQWREALENGDVAAIERIKQQLVELRAEMGEAVQPLLDAISDIEKQADTTFSSMTDSWVSALMDMESSAEDFAQTVGKTMAQKIITEMIAPLYLQPVLDAMQKVYDLAISQQGATISSVVAALRPFIGQITDVYNEVMPMIEDIFGSFGIYAETVEEAAEEVQYALQDMKSNFVSALMDMNNTAEDFSKEISKILAQSFIEKFVLGDKFDAQMKYWQEQYESIIGSGMSEEERKRQLTALRDAIAAAKEGYVDNAMAVMDLLGLTTEDSQEATMNMADKITYDQADQLLGTSLAQLLVQEQILATLHGGSVSYTPSGTLTGGSVADNEQSQLMLATMQSMSQMMQDRQDGILTQVAMANSHLQLIRDYNKQIRDEVVLHMASMDSKLSNLRNL